jgi:hypothetical protein
MPAKPKSKPKSMPADLVEPEPVAPAVVLDAGDEAAFLADAEAEGVAEPVMVDDAGPAVEVSGPAGEIPVDEPLVDEPVAVEEAAALVVEVPVVEVPAPPLTLAQVVAGGEWVGNELVVRPSLHVDAALEDALDALSMVHVRTSPGIATVLRRRG